MLRAPPSAAVLRLIAKVPNPAAPPLMRQDGAVRISSLVIGALLALAALLSPVAFPDASAVLAAVIAASLAAAIVAALWPRLSNMAPWLPSSAVLALAGGAAIGLAVVGPATAPLLLWSVCLGIATLALFVVQLLRGHGAKGRVDSMAAGIAGLLIVASGAGWVAWHRQLATTPQDHLFRALAVAGVLAIIAVLVAYALTKPRGVVLLVVEASAQESSEPSTPEGAAAELEAPAPRSHLDSLAVGIAAVVAIGVPVDLLSRALI